MGDRIREEISGLLAREIHDPGIGLITITRVEVTVDLLLARVFYTTLTDEAARAQTAKALTRALPFLRRQLAGRLRVRRVPELEFRFDASVEQHDRVERLIYEIQAERAARGEDTDTNDPKPE
jgi:ribosome-binding factor A